MLALLGTMGITAAGWILRPRPLSARLHAACWVVVLGMGAYVVWNLVAPGNLAVTLSVTLVAAGLGGWMPPQWLIPRRASTP